MTALDAFLREPYGPWVAVAVLVVAFIAVLVVFDLCYHQLPRQFRRWLESPPTTKDRAVVDLEAERERRDRIVHQAIRGVRSNRTGLSRDQLGRIAAPHLQRVMPRDGHD